MITLTSSVPFLVSLTTTRTSACCCWQIHWGGKTTTDYLYCQESCKRPLFAPKRMTTDILFPRGQEIAAQESHQRVPVINMYVCVVCRLCNIQMWSHCKNGNIIIITITIISFFFSLLFFGGGCAFDVLT